MPDPANMLATIVVPCYNEARRLNTQELRSFFAASRDIGFIFVDDGSKDDTLAVLEQLREGYGDRVRVLHKEPNAGKAEAVRHGMLEALRSEQAGAVGFWDADLATPLEAIHDLLQVLLDRPETRMVFGARVKLLGRNVERRAVRHYFGRIFATVVSILLRLPIYDTQCGAKLFRVTPELRDILSEPFSSRWVFDVELLARFIRLHQANTKAVRAAIYEFPLYSWRDVAGSKLKPTDFVRAFGDIVKIYCKYLA